MLEQIHSENYLVPHLSLENIRRVNGTYLFNGMHFFPAILRTTKPLVLKLIKYVHSNYLVMPVAFENMPIPRVRRWTMTYGESLRDREKKEKVRQKIELQKKDLKTSGALLLYVVKPKLIATAVSVEIETVFQSTFSMILK